MTTDPTTHLGYRAHSRARSTGTLVTLVNWTNEPVKNAEVKVRLSAKPSAVRSVQRQAGLASKWSDGQVTFAIDLDEADYVLIPR